MCASGKAVLSFPRSIVCKAEYNVTNTIEIPAHAPDGDAYQGGDYHFMITITDKAGFSVFKSV